MTYNQVVQEVKQILENHAMIKEVRFNTPIEWTNRDSVPELPVVLYSITRGSFIQSYQNEYNIEFWFLDKSGVEGEFETDVVSDMHTIAQDVVNALNLSSNKYSMSMPVSWNVVSDALTEDYLSGVTLNISITTSSQNTYCDFPVKQ